MSAFTEGLLAGQRMAQGWVDTYDTARRQREERELKARREGITTAQAEDAGMRYSPEQGAELERVAQSGMYDIGYDQDRQSYTVTPKGLGAAPVNPMDGAVPPAGLGDPYTPTPQPQAAMYAPAQRYGSFMGQEYEGEMTPERLQGLRNRAMLDTVDDPFERQRLELTQMQTEDVRGKREREAATRAAQQQLAERFATGQVMDVPAIYAMAAETGADATALVQSAATALELTDKQAKSMASNLVRDINKASTSPEKFNELLRSKFDPDPTDDKFPELRTNRDGSVQVFLGDQPLTQVFRSTKDMPALAQVASYYKDQIEGDPTRTAVQMLTLEKLRAQIRQSNRTSPGTPSLSQKVAEAERALGRNLTEEEKSVLVGLSSRPGTGGRAPTQAEITSRANLYIQNDQTGELTVEEAVAMAERDLAGGPAPVNPQRSLVDAAINPQPAAPARVPAGGPTPAGQQLLGLYNTVVPPAAQRQPAPPPAQTRQEQLRGFYVQQPR